MQHKGNRSRNRLLVLLVVVSLAGGLLIATRLLVQANSALAAVALDEAAKERGGRLFLPPLQETLSKTVYLPLIAQNFPLPPSVFGVEINWKKVSATASKADDAGVWWVRYNGILWSEVEGTQGVRDWSKLASVEEELRMLAERGLTPIVIVRGTPLWAQKVSGSYCGPIKLDALNSFASFMNEIVTRYSGAPYNVKYWELWNEPDVDPKLVNSTSPFGCWGDDGDNYYGGSYYAEMLERVYPAIKQADPAAQVMLGGLLLWCDPYDPNPQPETKGCISAKFLQGILQSGGGPFFDILAYHAYPYWNPGVGRKDWDLTQVHWDHRGGALLGKLDFIQDLFRQYSVNKPIMMNEGGLMCYSDDKDEPDCLSSVLLSDQANYVVRLYTRTWANGLLGSVWFTLNGPGWRQGGLLDSNQDLRPSYNTLKFMAQLLEGASYSGQLSGGSMEGYVFRNGKTHREYRIYWTNDNSTVSLSLPAGTSAVYNKSGQNITPGGGTISVDFEPIFIEVVIP